MRETRHNDPRHHGVRGPAAATAQPAAPAPPPWIQVQADALRIMAQSRDLGEMVPRLLEAICTGFGWQVGGFWIVEDEDHLTCVELYQAPDAEATAWEELSWQLRFAPGEGLPGQVWMHQRPVWVSDVLDRINMPRAIAAIAGGMRAGVCLPVRQMLHRPPRVCAVMEFVSREPIPDDPGLRESLELVCDQAGQFIERHALSRELVERHATSVQEEIVEGLWLAQTALETGQVEQAARLVDETIGVAERIADEAGEHAAPRRD